MIAGCLRLKETYTSYLKYESMNQIGTLGGGNHFIEMQRTDGYI